MDKNINKKNLVIMSIYFERFKYMLIEDLYSNLWVFLKGENLVIKKRGD